MDRRKFLIVSMAGMLMGVPAVAQSFSDSVVNQLRKQGFGRITTERTLLGRTRIVAIGNGGRREIILNPRTGEILRDLWIVNGSGGSGGSGGTGGGSIVADDDDDGGRGRGRGRGGDDDDDDDGDDNSGSGSSGDSGGDDGDDD